MLRRFRRVHFFAKGPVFLFHSSDEAILRFFFDESHRARGNSGSVTPGHFPPFAATPLRPSHRAPRADRTSHVLAHYEPVDSVGPPLPLLRRSTRTPRAA